MSTFILTKNNKNEVLGRLRKALFNNNRTEFKITIQDKDMPSHEKIEYKPLVDYAQINSINDLTTTYVRISIDVPKWGSVKAIYVNPNDKITFSGGMVIINNECCHITFSPVKFDKRKCYYYDKDCEDENGSDGCCTCAECFYLAKCKIAKERCNPEQRKFYGMEN